MLDLPRKGSQLSGKHNAMVLLTKVEWLSPKCAEFKGVSAEGNPNLEH